MGASKAPAAPPSPVSTQNLTGAWDSASENIDAAAGNTLPRQAYDVFAPQLMSATPYGFDPNQATQYANQWAAQGPQMFDYANQVMTTGFDPQDALYNRTQDRLTSQTRASQGARGIDMTPHGAGLENQAMSDFNIDWENAQLQRQALASQAAAQLFGQGGQAIQGGVQLGQQVPQNIATYAGALQQLGMGAYAPQMWAGQQYGNLFGTGANAQNAAYQNSLDRYKAQEQSSNSFWGGIGKLGGQLGSAAIMASDRRLKTNVVKLADDPRGFGVYMFNYLEDDENDTPQVGYMADEVEKIRPDVVHQDQDGIKYIDYGLLAA